MSGLTLTPINELAKIHERLYTTFRSGRCRSLSYRRTQLAGIIKMCEENVEAIASALFADLNKPRFEAIGFEVLGVISNARTTSEKLEEWTAPDVRTNDVADNYKLLRPTIHKTPKGPVLIITPWNFPLATSVLPVVTAIASGNPAVLKPSEITPCVAQLLAELLPKYVDPEAYVIVNGGVPETTRLLELKWAHIHYTGNGRVGRLIASAAAKHLTPVTLELGGKSPVYIDSTFDVSLAAKRILFGKNVNAGQVCIAPDYVLVHPSQVDALVAALKDHMSTFHPQGCLEDEKGYTKIVSAAHFKRLSGLLDRTNGKTALGGKRDEETLRFETTIVTDVKDGDALLSEEIFGPILPVVPVASVDDAIEFINSRDHPLLLYVFTDSEIVKHKFVDETISGGLVFNDTFNSVPNLPFGGVGESGYGNQGLKYGFDDFTHLRSMLDVPKELEQAFGIRYPPYSADGIKLLSGGAFQ